MKQKIAMLILGVCVLAIAVFTLAYRKNLDFMPPAIIFKNEILAYSDDMTEQRLLSDVRAEDDRDGDVSASLRIEEIYVNTEDSSVSIIYTAKDSRNNIAKAWRTLPMHES